MTELSLTRIFSVTMYYHFAFLAISIALFGLSASGVYVFLRREAWRDVATESLLAWHAFAYTIVTAAALIVLVRLRVGLNYSPSNIALMCVMYLLSALPFFAGGAAISIAISRLTGSVNAIYAADLLGAGAGCLLLMPALNQFGAPGAIVISSLLGLVAASCFVAPAARRRLALSAVICAFVVGGAAAAGAFRVSTTKGHEQDQVLFSKWNSFSRIGVYNQSAGGSWSLSATYKGAMRGARLMDIDSAAATQIMKWCGDERGAACLENAIPALANRARRPRVAGALPGGSAG